MSVIEQQTGPVRRESPRSSLCSSCPGLSRAAPHPPALAGTRSKKNKNLLRVLSEPCISPQSSIKTVTRCSIFSWLNHRSPLRGVNAARHYVFYILFHVWNYIKESLLVIMHAGGKKCQYLLQWNVELLSRREAGRKVKRAESGVYCREGNRRGESGEIGHCDWSGMCSPQVDFRRAETQHRQQQRTPPYLSVLANPFIAGSDADNIELGSEYLLIPVPNNKSHLEKKRKRYYPCWRLSAVWLPPLTLSA